jgi:hypothetical protein
VAAAAACVWHSITFSVIASYGLQKPDHAIFEHHPTINSELLHYIKLGRIRPHPDIAKITDDTVQFVDGTSEQFDMIVYATGYNLGTAGVLAVCVCVCVCGVWHVCQ